MEPDIGVWMLAIERAFAVKLTDDQEVKTFGDVVDLVDRLVVARGGRRAPGGWFQRCLWRDLRTAVWHITGDRIRPSTCWSRIIPPRNPAMVDAFLRHRLAPVWGPATESIRISSRRFFGRSGQLTTGDTVRAMLSGPGAFHFRRPARAEIRTVLAWMLEDMGADHHSRISEDRSLITDLLVGG